MAVVKTNRTRSPIVSVVVNKVDPRESEARNLIMWLKTIPVKAIHNPMSHVINLHNANMRAVDCLLILVEPDFDVTVAGETFDFLRIRKCIDPQGKPAYAVTYLEYMQASEEHDEHYSSMCLQAYPHVVDAFKCFQFRIESEFPYKSVKV